MATAPDLKHDPTGNSKQQYHLPWFEGRERDCGLVTPDFIELAQTARNMSSSGDPSRKDLASQNL